MAKQSLINRNEQRKETVKKFAAKRKALRDAANDQALTPEDRYEARLKLQKLPRNADGPSSRHLSQVRFGAR
jgi:small subunit ribosomal protein S14